MLGDRVLGDISANYHGSMTIGAVVVDLRFTMGNWYYPRHGSGGDVAFILIILMSHDP